ncbi:MAG: hypothetical protein ACREGH_00445, partial [Minisyncoccia bacterium]
GIIVIAFNAPAFFSELGHNWFGSATTTPATSTPTGVVSQPESLSLSATPTTLQSGGSVTLSWQDSGATAPRAFIIAWKCTDGVSVEAPVPTGAYRSVPCNAGFNYTNAATSTSLRVSYTGASPIALTFGVSAISLSTGSTTAKAQIDITVEPAKASAPKPSAPQPAPQPVVKAGVPDLSVRILSIGYINANGAYVALPSGYAYSTAQYPTMAVQFNVQNIGTGPSRAGWEFTANLPTTPSYPYTSAPQAALGSESGDVFTLRWTNPQAPASNCYTPQTQPWGWRGGCEQQYTAPPAPLTITIDPLHVSGDANWSNNAVTVTL